MVHCRSGFITRFLLLLFCRPAPAACRAALPEANPGIYVTASLGITFPFNLAIGVPLIYALSGYLY
ncbi:MAG: hypothetical protein CMI15_10205 [Opitutaceae bacterium]|nr:hypothetical protein [Opitutaceae bacterium]